MSSIPIDDPEAFEQWVMKVWQEKEELLDYCAKHRHFPAEKEAVAESSFTPKDAPKEFNPAILNTVVQLKSIFELWHLFSIPVITGILASLLARCWNLYWYGTFHF
jgi:Acyltransferase C-terminus